MPPVTQSLLIANVAIFLIQQFMGSMVGWFALWPPSSGLFMPWQVLTYAFLHGGLTHLAFNMFGLWMFGGELERVWGPRRLLAFYAVSVLTAAAAQLAVTAVLGSNVPTIGASGGLFGLLIGFAMVFPRRTITPLLPPIPMPAWLFVTLYGLIELTLGVTGSASGIAHFAHLGGLLGGWLVMRYWRGQPPFGRRTL
ncbi:MAG: rhomboid family intramembrane serine protease [Polaromonas sp. 39-63-203]|jgi:membrane associated rhomboid family serine protease|uniref:rhomboid family intramembrane serine protease n=1 Tax=Polaromonas sp. TaxID=1869339 RepID=UPI000BCF9D30|nr:rhomboid family intramembrane serine protease [Polaromonas sp.]OYY54159.1 MAG: rhomboid family intramembrane serine protease [Polaromonas sp. 35-63-240]OYZ03560.1 MAG: rhomboid family intramembrane serine protease [Polaromonas sp. 28-63-22]OYZ85341.1 MAG: rhomboid family intramembrane serine protease [Polaromonas sp. 24-62-144]OZB02531.1 MAG: rhomboid family intramembrane serine protease [Polaromonas sp. 39-63-203]HQS31357.1 rhomboid family intramembrane serine protease [Polaromonas sp.]